MKREKKIHEEKSDEKRKTEMKKRKREAEEEEPEAGKREQVDNETIRWLYGGWTKLLRGREVQRGDIARYYETLSLLTSADF